MPPSESSYSADWIRIADKDLKRVENLLSLDDPDGAGFYLQQTIEKYLKAFLLFKGWQLKRVHDLETLINDALAHDSSLEEFRALCQTVSGFYFLERYPLPLAAGVSDEDVRDALDEARLLIARLRVSSRAYGELVPRDWKRHAQM